MRTHRRQDGLNDLNRRISLLEQLIMSVCKQEEDEDVRQRRKEAVEVPAGINVPQERDYD